MVARKARPGTLVFDFDGVIANSMPTQEKAWLSAIQNVLSESANIEKDIVRNLYEGRAGEQMFDRVALTAKQRRLLRSEKDREWRRLNKKVEVFEGVAEVLPVLSSKYSICIATTAEKRYVMRLLEREALLRHIDYVITDEDVSQPKPDPEMLLKIGELTGADLSRICMIGDTVADMEMSHKARCCFVLMQIDGRSRVSLDNFQDRMVTNWYQLPDVLGSCIDNRVL